MSKTIEIPDIAQWEETDSELAKKNILELSNSIKYHIDFNKKLIDEINRLEMTIDIKNKRIDELNKRLDKKGKRIDKAIEYIKTHSNCGGSVQEGKFIIEHIEEIYDGMELLDILRGKDNGKH